MFCSCCIFAIAKHTTIFHRKLTLATISIVSALPIILNSGLRYYVGTDYIGYVGLFYKLNNNIYSFNFFSYKEPLYVFFNKLIAFFNGSPQWIFIVMAFIFSLCVFSRISEDSPLPILSICFLFITKQYFEYLNISRQMCSCAIIFYSIKYIVNRNFTKFFFFWLIATSLHLSAIICLPLYYLANIKLKPLFIVLLTFIFTILRPIIRNIGVYFIGLTKYAHYIGSKYDSPRFALLGLIVQILVFLIAFYFIKNTKKNNVYLNMQLYSVWLMIYSGILPLIERFKFYFILPQIILLAITISHIRPKELKILVLILLLFCYSMYTYVGIAVVDNLKVLPYRSVIFEDVNF